MESGFTLLQLPASSWTAQLHIAAALLLMQVLRLEEFGVTGADASNICYLRDIRDAAFLVDAMRAGQGLKAVVIGGGYIGMECTAALVANKLDVTVVYPEPHCSEPHAVWADATLLHCGFVGMSYFVTTGPLKQQSSNRTPECSRRPYRIRVARLLEIASFASFGGTEFYDCNTRSLKSKYEQSYGSG